jgi:hypothetical protein
LLRDQHLVESPQALRRALRAVIVDLTARVRVAAR